jgi:hypothetical protein
MGELQNQTLVRATPTNLNNIWALGLGSDPAVEVTTFEKGAGAHVDENCSALLLQKVPFWQAFPV